MKWIGYSVIVMCLLHAACKQAYNAPVKSLGTGTGHLVVEGFISSGTTSIQLSRTVKISDTANIIYEHNAQVAIEGSGSENIPLMETGSNGVYTDSNIVLNNAEQYRVHIHTSDGKEYMSDFESVTLTPPIDSVSWVEQSDGVQIYANTHDPQNNVKYYLWNYEETWEIHSQYQSTIKYKRNPATNLIVGVEFRLPNYAYDTSIYKCWVYKPSTSILTASTDQLSGNVVYKAPLVFIPKAARELSILFTINVKQFGMSQAAYNYYQILKKNTEELGTIFDAQPSLLKGNIHSVSDPSEMVIGYIDVSNEHDQRIYISPDQVPDWNYQSGCVLYDIGDGPAQPGTPGGLEPVSPNKILSATQIETYFAADQLCVLCTLTGTNKRPSFWPN